MGNRYELILGLQLLLLGCSTFANPTIQKTRANLPVPAQNEEKLRACYSCWGRNCSTGSCMGKICVNTFGFDNATSTMHYFSGCRNETKGLQPNNHSCPLWVLPMVNRSILEMSCSYCDDGDFCNGPERPLKLTSASDRPTATTTAAITVSVKPTIAELSAATNALQTPTGFGGGSPPITTSMQKMTTAAWTTSSEDLQAASTAVKMSSSTEFIPTLAVSTQDPTSSTLINDQRTEQITSDLTLPTATAAVTTSGEKSQTMPATNEVYSFATTLGNSSAEAAPSESSTVALTTFPIGEIPTTSSTEATTSLLGPSTSQVVSDTVAMLATTATEPWAMGQETTTNTLPVAIGSSNLPKLLSSPQRDQTTVGLFAAFSGLAVAVTLLALVSVGVVCFACGARFERRRRNHQHGVVTLQNFGELRKDKATFEML